MFWFLDRGVTIAEQWRVPWLTISDDDGLKEQEYIDDDDRLKNQEDIDDNDGHNIRR